MQDQRVRGNVGGLGRVMATLDEAARIPREQTCPADVAEFEEQHDDTLKTDTSATMLCV